MKLGNGWHLAYCTNIHRGESWSQTLGTLNDYTLRVRDQVCPDKAYAIGLRLGAKAASELAEPSNLAAFRKWLADHNCYVFTINGFPYGSFHGTRVKEDVYRPDWTSRERVDYTKLLFRLLAELADPEAGGSISTVPCPYKEFIHHPDAIQQMRVHLWEMVDYISQLKKTSGKDLHLGLEPEPLCFLETSTELVDFIHSMREMDPLDDRIESTLGVNYDTCHLAIEFEEPTSVLKRFVDNNIRISKIHLSSALKVQPDASRLDALKAFRDTVYFHQVISRQSATGAMRRYRDLDDALELAHSNPPQPGEEWRIHFHIPLHSPTNDLFSSTSDHITALLDELTQSQNLCHHFEMETYTWEVLPESIRSLDVVDQLVAEYQWTLTQLNKRSIAAV
ncbi:MAG: metabolite traffic protein EboE [Verrucomicrobia bacterium]|nr:metabolite traffic protein EboE [Verrucomicrobiota bacterium]